MGVCVISCAYPTLLQSLFAHREQVPPGQIFKVKTGWAHKKLRGGGGVATSVGGGEMRGESWVEKRGGSSCRNESGHC